jgi:hypothetical protein
VAAAIERLSRLEPEHGRRYLFTGPMNRIGRSLFGERTWAVLTG